MTDPAAVIFDLDGTLHHTEKALVPAIRMAMADLGLEPASPEAINALYGEPLEVFCRDLLKDMRGECDAFRLGIRKHQRATLQESGSLYSGIPEMLRELSGMDMKLAVCSNAGTDYIDLVTSTLGISGCFDSVRGSDGNPSKASRVLEIMDETGCSRAVMVGDRYHDIEAAREARIPSIGCLYGYGSPGEMRKADMTVKEPAGIVNAVCRLLGLRSPGRKATPGS